MAQKTSVVVRDDLTGGKAAETISFALDGKAYEIDLNKRNAAAMRKAIGVYIDAGRPAPKVTRVRRAAGTTAARTGRPAKNASPSQADVRTWATEHGIEVSARGRISNAVRDQYIAAQAG
jgi:hypothetical protein